MTYLIIKILQKAAFPSNLLIFKSPLQYLIKIILPSRDREVKHIKRLVIINQKKFNDNVRDYFNVIFYSCLFAHNHTYDAISPSDYCYDLNNCSLKN